MNLKRSENRLRSSCWEQRTEDDRRNVACIIFLMVLVLGSALLFVGCGTTVTPDVVPSTQASFDGGQQNSGIIMSTASGFVVTDHFRARYNALILKYGGDFSPMLKPDSGIAPIGDDRWLISKQGMVDFLQMNTWRRAGLEPKGTKTH